MCDKAEPLDRLKPKKPITWRVLNINFVTLFIMLFSIIEKPNLTFPYRRKKKRSFSCLFFMFQTLLFLSENVLRKEDFKDQNVSYYNMYKWVSFKVTATNEDNCFGLEVGSKYGSVSSFDFPIRLTQLGGTWYIHKKKSFLGIFDYN